MPEPTGRCRRVPAWPQRAGCPAFRGFGWEGRAGEHAHHRPATRRHVEVARSSVPVPPEWARWYISVTPEGEHTPYHSGHVLQRTTPGGPTPTRVPAGHWLEMVRRQERRGELLAAYDIANRGLGAAPRGRGPGLPCGPGAGEDRVDHRRRSADSSSSTSPRWTPRTWPLWGAHPEGPGPRRLGRRAASPWRKPRPLAYQRIADQNGAYFPAINAATLQPGRRRSGHGEGAGPESHCPLVEASGEASYYAAATRAEAALLLGDADGRAELSWPRPDSTTATSARCPRRDANCA